MPVFRTACRGCHGGCLYELTVENGRVVKARPSKEGPLNRGRGCVKGMSIVEQMYHPQRLLYPMKRLGERGSGKWQRISWEEAYETIAARMRADPGLWARVYFGAHGHRTASSSVLLPAGQRHWNAEFFICRRSDLSGAQTYRGGDDLRALCGSGLLRKGEARGHSGLGSKSCCQWRRW